VLQNLLKPTEILFYCGYDLSKRFDGSVGFFWNATQQQIYRELAKLEDQGWISPQTISQQGRPDKKLYSVTDFGRKHRKVVGDRW
jgi:DNA-binding PadR family transcriptional regulator